jgi:DNA-binding NtrC family response regulator
LSFVVDFNRVFETLPASLLFDGFSGAGVNMQTLECIVVFPPQSNRRPEVHGFQIAKARDFQDLKKLELPAAFLVKTGDLPWIRRYTEIIVDKGRNTTKGLYGILCRVKPGFIGLIDGDYTQLGRVLTGVEALMKKAAHNEKQNVFLVGIAENHFSSLRDRFQETQPDTVADDQTVPLVNAKDMDEIAYQLLHEKIGRQNRAHRKKMADLAKSFIGESREIKMARLLILLASENDAPVLILGDTGTGKEVVAREIHNGSRRGHKKFVTVNCGAIPGELFESELFGHLKGSFTNATSNKMGLWEYAGRGTLFLDEIGDLKLEHQVKILRALDEKRIRKVGATEGVHVAARVIAATNRDLFGMVRAGHFREDLYYRLRGFFIRTPTLRSRPDDIPLLSQFFWKKISKNKKNRLPAVVLKKLQSYRWPGNARELKMVLQNLYSLFGHATLTLEHIQVVFSLEGLPVPKTEEPVTEKEILLHRAESLRHLRKVDEVIRAMKHTVSPAFDKADVDSGWQKTVLESVAFNHSELTTLCRKPLLFYNETTFSAVWQFKDKLSCFKENLNMNPVEVQEYWNTILKREFDSVLSIIFKSVEDVVAIRGETL